LGPALLFGVVLCSAPDLTHPSLSPRSASASTFVELSVAELVSKSTLVVAGTPLDSRSLWEDSDGARGRRIVTYTRVRVDRLIDGKVSGEVWVRTLGGAVDDIGQHVDGEAVLPAEKPSLLFLRALPDGTHAVVGMAQGNYPLETPADGSAPRLMAPRGIGRLLSKAQPLYQSQAQPQSQSDLPARVVLAGQTLDVAERVVLAERRLHAP
jgi:hypothetical protein